MNAPKLRFKEFNDEWSTENLSKVVTFSKGNSLSKSDLDESGPYPCILYGELYTKYHEVIRKVFSKTNHNSGNVVKSKYGDILIPASGETPVDISTASCLLLDNVLLGGDINILSPKNCDGRFISYVISNNKRKSIARVAQGHSIVHLYSENLKKIKLDIPSLKEQKKIADMLELLDKKIELQIKKIEALKLFKKGLSPMIFNSINIISEKKLGNICSIKTGKLDANAMTTNGKYRFYTCAKNYYYTDNYAFDNEALLISGNGAYVGYIHYYKGKFNAYQRTYVLDSFLENIQYVKVYLEEFLPKRISLEKKEGNTPYIVLSTLYDMKIKLTDSKTEDKVINLFFYVNSKIKQESEKFNKYNELKKGLIQSMFI